MKGRKEGGWGDEEDGGGWEGGGVTGAWGAAAF